MSLKKYWQKRDFSITSEPRGAVTKPGKTLAFYIQRHHARRLHYDFRLELDGTLKSWAVPKGPSFDPSDKRLAVHVEDHPLSYGTFEGDIPAGQYGAGQVVLWDRGEWLPLGDPRKGYRDGNLKFELHGEKLAGKWALVRMGRKNQEKDEQENWLLIKEHDAFERSHDEYQVTEARPESVLKLKAKKAAKTPTELKENTKENIKDKATSQAKAPSKTAKLKAAAKTVAQAISQVKLKKTVLPEQLRPQLATLVKSAPSGDDWLCEIKYDGYRALTRIEKLSSKQQQVRIFTRNGNDWTAHWPPLAEALEALPVESAWLDGEVVAIQDGKISFGALQNYDDHAKGGKAKSGQKASQVQLCYYLFDIVHLNGQDLSQLPLLERKALLKTLLETLNPAGPILYSEHIVGHVAEVFKQACDNQLEGVVIKRADATYAQTRSQNWLKLKCVQRQEFVIGGYTDPEGARTGFGALLLGWYNADGELMYAGRVGTGFNQQNIAAIEARMQKLETARPAYVNPPKGYEAKGVHWLKPQLVGEVKFAEWTTEGSVRHAAFIALRDDKKPQDITRETAVKPQALTGAAEDNSDNDADQTAEPAKQAKKAKKAEKAKPMKSAKAKPADTAPATSAKPSKKGAAMDNTATPDDRAASVVAGITISHPERVVFSQGNITKLALAQYYASVEQWIMPHIVNRPLSLLRCPEGAAKECFFQKHLGELTLKYVEKLTIPGNDNGAYLIVRDIRGLIELVQMGVIEFHTWGSTTAAIHQPDRMIFDLDPDPAVGWPQVMEGAKLVQYLLSNLGLECFLKTTGGKGLHVVVPIKPEHDFAVIKEFSKSIANHLAETIPSHFVAVMSKAKRKDKIFIDYLRNGEEATAIAAFSVRAREGAPISVPIDWSELSEDLPSNYFNVENILPRLLDLKEDPWLLYERSEQVITDKMLHTFD